MFFSVCSAQWFPTFFDTFLPLLIFKLFIPRLWNFKSSLVRVRKLAFTTIGTIVFIEDITLINKSETKTIYCRIMALNFVNKDV